MCQEVRAEKANEGREVIERDLSSLTDDNILSCSGERASLYRPGLRRGVQPYHGDLAGERSHEGHSTWYHTLSPYQGELKMAEGHGGKRERHDASQDQAPLGVWARV